MREPTREEWRDWALVVEEPKPKMVYVWGWGWVTQAESNRLQQNCTNQLLGKMFNPYCDNLLDALFGLGTSAIGGTCPTCGK